MASAATNMITQVARVVSRSAARGGLTAGRMTLSQRAATAVACHSSFSPILATRSMSTVGALYAQRTEEYPNKDALKVHSLNVKLERRHLETNVNAFAAGLLELGYKKGTKLAVWLGNEVEQVVAVLAACKIGATVVSLDPALSTDAALDVVKAEGCRGLLFGTRFGGRARPTAVAEMFPDLDLSMSEDLVNDKRYRALKHLIHTGTQREPGMMPWSSVPVADPMPDPLPMVAASLAPTDVAIVSYAANADGTAAAGVQLTQNDLLVTAQATAASLELTPDDIVLVAAAPHTRFGIAAGHIAAAQAGAEVVIASREPSAKDVAKAAARYKATVLVADEEAYTELVAGDADLATITKGLVATTSAAADAAIGTVALATVDASAVQSGAALA